MAIENVKKFFELVKSDEDLAREIAKIKDEIQNKGETVDYEQIISKKVIPMAKKHGLDFTMEDFLKYTNSMVQQGELSDDDLLNVSGGMNFRQGLATGLLMLTVGTTGLSLMGNLTVPGGDGSGSGGAAPTTSYSQSINNGTEDEEVVDTESDAMEDNDFNDEDDAVSAAEGVSMDMLGAGMFDDSESEADTQGGAGKSVSTNKDVTGGGAGAVAAKSSTATKNKAAKDTAGSYAKWAGTEATKAAPGNSVLKKSGAETKAADAAKGVKFGGLDENKRVADAHDAHAKRIDNLVKELRILKLNSDKFFNTATEGSEMHKQLYDFFMNSVYGPEGLFWGGCELSAAQANTLLRYASCLFYKDYSEVTAVDCSIYNEAPELDDKDLNITDLQKILQELDNKEEYVKSLPNVLQLRIEKYKDAVQNIITEATKKQEYEELGSVSWKTSRWSTIGKHIYGEMEKVGFKIDKFSNKEAALSQIKAYVEGAETNFKEGSEEKEQYDKIKKAYDNYSIVNVASIFEDAEKEAEEAANKEADAKKAAEKEEAKKAAEEAAKKEADAEKKEETKAAKTEATEKQEYNKFGDWWWHSPTTSWQDIGNHILEELNNVGLDINNFSNIADATSDIGAFVKDAKKEKVDGDTYDKIKTSYDNYTAEVEKKDLAKKVAEEAAKKAAENEAKKAAEEAAKKEINDLVESLRNGNDEKDKLDDFWENSSVDKQGIQWKGCVLSGSDAIVLLNAASKKSTLDYTGDNAFTVALFNESAQDVKDAEISNLKDLSNKLDEGIKERKTAAWPQELKDRVDTFRTGLKNVIAEKEEAKKAAEEKAAAEEAAKKAAEEEATKKEIHDLAESLRNLKDNKLSKKMQNQLNDFAENYKITEKGVSWKGIVLEGKDAIELINHINVYVYVGKAPAECAVINKNAKSVVDEEGIDKLQELLNKLDESIKEGKTNDWPQELKDKVKNFREEAENIISNAVEYTGLKEDVLALKSFADKVETVNKLAEVLKVSENGKNMTAESRAKLEADTLKLGFVLYDVNTGSFNVKGDDYFTFFEDGDEANIHAVENYYKEISDGLEDFNDKGWTLEGKAENLVKELEDVNGEWYRFSPETVKTAVQRINEVGAKIGTDDGYYLNDAWVGTNKNRGAGEDGLKMIKTAYDELASLAKK